MLKQGGQPFCKFVFDETQVIVNAVAVFVFARDACPSVAAWLDRTV